MKTLIIILSLISISFNVSSQIISEFESGILTFNSKTITPDSQTSYEQNTFYSKFYFGYQYKDFTFLTETDIFFYKKNSSKSFSPVQSQFLFSLSYDFKNITFGYSHLCSHPISNRYNDNFYRKFFYQSYDKFYIKIKLVNNNL